MRRNSVCGDLLVGKTERPRGRRTRLTVAGGHAAYGSGNQLAVHVTGRSFLRWMRRRRTWRKSGGARMSLRGRRKGEGAGESVRDGWRVTCA
jgi:hypothetical protein